MSTIPNLAGRPERLLAYLLDTIILVAPALVIAALFDTKGGIGLIVAFLVNAGYYTYFTASTWQATAGQRLLSVHVEKRDGSMISMRDALERYLAFFLPTVPIYSSLFSAEVAQMLTMWLLIVWFLPILIDKERRGLHDKLCNMRVVAGRL